MALTDLQCKTSKAGMKPVKLADGEGMYLHIMPGGGKKFRMKYMFLGKEKTYTIGPYPLTTLQEAREARTAAKKLLAAGKDPCEERKLSKLEQHKEYDNTFEAMAREWHEKRVHTWKARHGANILKRLETHVFPDLGARPISRITPHELLQPIQEVEKAGTIDLAHRLMQTCSQVFRYAVATGRAKADATSDLAGALKPTPVKHWPYLEEQDLPEFLQKLSEYDTRYGGKRLTKLAFQLLIHVFLRSGEFRGGKWDEINYKEAQWKIPAERMKMKETHIVPLSKQSIALLRQIQEITGASYGGLMFPSQVDPRKPISENTFAKILEVMGYKGQVVPHGFRSTASTILNEGGFNRDHVERQLAHAERDQVRAAYNYAEYLPERARMMQWWSDHLAKLKEAPAPKRKATRLPR